MIFRKINATDASLIYHIRNLSRNFLHDNSEYSLENVREWFELTKPDWYIIQIDKEIPIGYFRLSNYSKLNRNMYIGADLDPIFRGKGYAKQAYNEFIPFIFLEYNLHKLTLEVLSTNTIAINLYQKLGFKETGRKPEEIFRNGEFIDSIIMTLFKREVN